MNNTNNPMQALQNIINLANNGNNPQAVMQMLLQKNPQYQQTLNQIKTMANGMPMDKFVMQLAKQRGLDQNTLSQIERLLVKR